MMLDHPEAGRAVLLDQKPMHNAGLRRRQQDGLMPPTGIAC